MRPLKPSNAYGRDFYGGEYRAEEEEFLRAMALYQKRQGRRYPTWCEVLYVLHCLGYRKVASAVEPLDEVTAWRDAAAASEEAAEVEKLVALLRQRWGTQQVQPLGKPQNRP
jgi:hypothetical protein